MDHIDERTFRYARNLIARLPLPNRQTAERYIQLKANAGLAANSIYNQAKAISLLGEQLGPRPFATTTADDLIALVARARRVQKPHTIGQTCVLLRRFLKDVLDADSLPRPLRLALTIKLPRLASTRRPVTQDEWAALLEASQRVRAPAPRLRLQAILWTLRYSGMRASELLSLNVGSVELAKDGGAFLEIPKDGARLKTGPRRPYVLDCVPALKAWLSIHPCPGNPDAPLFPAVRPGPTCRRGTYHGLLIQIQNLSRTAGLRTISPHLFRHARATEMARNRWMDNNATKQMGWTPGSKMWNHYTHLVDDDLIAQVRQDAGIDNQGRPAPLNAQPTDAASELARLLRLLLATQNNPHPRPPD